MPGGGLHQHPVPRADLARPVRGVLERLAGDRRRPARGRRQLAVPARQGAVARDPDPAVRAGHRHPQRGAQGAGRAAAGVVRRALDHLGLRPVRGERPLLPGAAADHRRRGPARGARGRRHPARSPSCGCTTARSTAGTARSTTSPTACRTCASRTACCAAGPTVADTMANAAFYFGLVRALAESERPLWSQMSFSAAEENFHVAAQQGIDAQVYWPGVGQVRATELVLRRLLPLAHEGLDAWGVAGGGARPAARHHRAALPDRDQRRRVVRRAGCAERARHGAVRRAAGDAAGVPRAACTPTSRCTPGTEPLSRRPSPQPLPLPAHAAARVAPAVPGDDDQVSGTPGLGVGGPGRGAARRRRRPAARARRAGSARPAAPAPAAPARRSSAATTSVRSAWSSGRPARRRRTPAAAGAPDVQHGGEAPARARPCAWLEHRRAQQQRASVARHRVAEQRPSPTACRTPTARGARVVHRLPPSAADSVRCQQGRRRSRRP